jgi:hypothetical protein
MAEDFPGDNGQVGCEGQADLEALVDWNSRRKATRSLPHGDCVVVAPGKGAVGFQDSKHPENRFAVPVEAAKLYLGRIAAGEYDHL